MERYYYQRYLDDFSPEGRSDCSCGRRHSLAVKETLLGDRVLERLPELVRKLHGANTRIWILSDGNTEQAAGRACKDILSAFRLSQQVLPARPRLRTTPEVIQQAARQAYGSAADLIIAVGAGTISDVAKKVSELLQVPNWCVATAPSVDAYSSGTAAVKYRHGHKTESCWPSEVILGELSVLEAAPQDLILSGLGDLLAKYLSYLDWRLSALVTGEHICERSARACLESARAAVAAAGDLSSDRKKAVRTLADAVLTSGFSMQSLAGSRPASSAEHTIAHYWEIAHAVGNPDYDLHGLLVGLSCRILLQGFRSFFADPQSLAVDIPRRLAQFSEEPNWEQALVPQLAPVHRQMREEMAGAGLDRRVLEARLQALDGSRGQIESLIGETIGELSEAVRVLDGVSYPFGLGQYRIEAEQVLLPIRYVRFLRNRYSTFSLVYEAGREEQLQERFGEVVREL